MLTAECSESILNDWMSEPPEINTGLVDKGSTKLCLLQKNVILKRFFFYFRGRANGLNNGLKRLKFHRESGVVNHRTTPIRTDHRLVLK